MYTVLTQLFYLDILMVIPLSLNPLDGVYYCDIRPNMKTEKILKDHIKTFDNLLIDDIWEFAIANAPSQAHLQGTQSRHTKANLAKEPALFPRFLDTPNFGGHRRYSDTPERRVFC